MNSRRTFIKKSALFGAGMAFLPSCAAMTLESKKTVGLQLYSLRDVIKNDIRSIIEKIAVIGYKEVETYDYSKKNGFWGLSATAFKDLLKQNGLTSPSGHFAMDNFMSGKNNDELKSYIEASNILGSQYITVPYLDNSLRKTADDYKKVAQKLNEAATLCKAAGLKIAYHNHDFEFKKIGNTTGYEIMLTETDKDLVDFELDLYWAVVSGVDPLVLFKTHPNRFTMWHIKDIDKINKNVNTEIGQGKVDFKSIFTGAEQAGVKHYFVEHEFNYKPDQLGSIKTSFNYVKDQLL